MGIASFRKLLSMLVTVVAEIDLDAQARTRGEGMSPGNCGPTRHTGRDRRDETKIQFHVTSREDAKSTSGMMWEDADNWIHN